MTVIFVPSYIVLSLSSPRLTHNSCSINKYVLNKWVLKEEKYFILIGVPLIISEGYILFPMFIDWGSLLNFLHSLTILWGGLGWVQLWCVEFRVLVGSQRELKLLVLETVSLEITQEKAVSPCFLHGVCGPCREQLSPPWSASLVVVSQHSVNTF